MNIWFTATVFSIILYPVIVLSPLIIKDYHSPTRRTVLSMKYIREIYLYGVKILAVITVLTAASGYLLSSHLFALTFVVLSALSGLATLACALSVFTTPTTESELYQNQQF